MRSLLATLLAISCASCAAYDAPPEVTIVGAEQGQLSGDPSALALSFSKAPKPSTLKFEIARYDHDSEGSLFDEDADPATSLDLLFSHDPLKGDTGGASILAGDHLSDSITFEAPAVAGTQYVLLIEPGLADEAGAITNERRRVVFAYTSPLMCDAPAQVMRSGAYFLIAAITKPVALQAHLFGVLDIDPATGNLNARFTKAKRNPDPNRCTPPCNASEVCRLVPMPACIAPSDPAGSPDDFPDYVPDPDPPTGWGFATAGCSVDQSATSATLATVPVDIMVAMPMATLVKGTINGLFTEDGDGVLRGSGSLAADVVLIGTDSYGIGQGDITARSIPEGMVPPGLPGP